MCDGKDVKRQLEDARDLEKVNPKRSRQYYLEAAETLLYLSTTDKQNEKKYVLLADKAYKKAQQLKPLTTTEEKNVIQDKYMIASSLSFKDIGGLQELKDEITYKIIKPFLHPELYDYYGKKIGGGILMYGPPGCGKSMMAEATANEAGATFFNVKCSDLKSKFVGETEKNIAELFRSARENSPSIIFFDEFESIGSDRTNSVSYEKNAVAQLLTEMDGVGNKNQKILLLAATNEPWSIDPALLREGRFGTSLFIGLPDELAQKSILQLNLENKPLSREIEMRNLLPLTKNLSGADIMGLCEAAADIPLREFFRTKNKRSITMQDFASASTKVQSVMQPWFSKAIKQVVQKNLMTQFPDLVKAGKKVVAV